MTFFPSIFMFPVLSNLFSFILAHLNFLPNFFVSRYIKKEEPAPVVTEKDLEMSTKEWGLVRGNTIIMSSVAYITMGTLLSKIWTYHIIIGNLIKYTPVPCKWPIIIKNTGGDIFSPFTVGKAWARKKHSSFNVTKGSGKGHNLIVHRRQGHGQGTNYH